MYVGVGGCKRTILIKGKCIILEEENVRQEKKFKNYKNGFW